MTHFMQLPNKTISLLDQELALKNGELTFEFNGTEKVLVTESALQNAIAGMSAPLTVGTKTELDALTNEQVDIHKRIFVEDDGDGKWAYYMVTDISGESPAYIKVSDEDIFGALFSDDVTAQISKIGDLADLEPGMLSPATLIEGINTAYLQGVALNTRVGLNEDLTTSEKGTIVAAMNELVVNISSNDGDILTIQNNIGDLTTINLTDALDKSTIVAAINKVLAVQSTKLDAEDVVPIIISYTGLLTELTTVNQNSLVEAINEIVADVQSKHDGVITLVGDLTTLTNTNNTTGLVATTIVGAINDVDADLSAEVVRATDAEATLTSNLATEAATARTAEALIQTNLDTEAATRAANDGDLNTLTTDAKSNLVSAINEVDSNSDAETARALAAEAVIDSNLSAEAATRAAADTALQAELDATQVGSGLETNGDYTANSTANYIATATTLKDADDKLDAQVKVNTDGLAAEVTRATAAEGVNAAAITTEQTRAEGVESGLQTELDNTQANIGLTADGSYVANAAYDETNNPTGSHYISTAVTLTDADNKLDAQIKVQADALISEAATRLGADQTLQTNIDSTNANLAQEVTDRTAADAALQSSITALEGQVGTNIGDLSTLTTDDKTTLVAAINEVDAHNDTNATAIATETANRIADVNDEETRALAAELVLTNNLAAEVTRATDAETTLTTNLAAEVTRATDAETTLTNDLAAEVTRATTAEGNLTFDSSLNTESDAENNPGVFDLAPADITTAINAEVTRAKTAEAVIQAVVDANEIEATGLITQLQTDLNTEIARATLAEETLDTKIDTAVSNLVDGAPVLLDTLNELAAAIGDDENFAVTVANDIANAKAELKGSASLAMDTMGEIEAAIAANIANQTAIDAAQDTALANEITRATNAEAANTTAINNEVTRATGIEAGLQAELDATQTGAGLGTDGTYTADATTNYLTTVTTLKGADKALDDAIKVNETAIAAETTRATTAESTLTTNLAQEVTDRTAAVNTLTTNLAQEVTDRTTADAALQSAITALEGQVGTNIGDLSTLTTDDKTTLVAAINEVDAHNDTNTAGLAQEVADRAAAISTEEGIRLAADNALQAELDATQVGAGLTVDGDYVAAGVYDATTNPTGAHFIGTASTLKDADKKLDAQVKVNTDGLAAEATRATAAEAALSNDISTEESARIAADTVLTNDLAAEVTRATAAESTLQANIDAETLRAVAAEGNLGFNAALQVDDGQGGTVLASNLTEAINAEVARASAAELVNTNAITNEATTARAAESTLQTNINNEESARIAADTTLQTNIDTEEARAIAAELVNANAITDEQTRAEGVEATLSASITTEAGTRSANDGSLVFNAPLASATNLTDAINAELARATTAEALVQTNLDSEVTRATTAETTLTNDLAAEVARATAAEQANTAAITALEGATNTLVGDLANLNTDTKTTVVGAINEVNTETDINTAQVASIKAFINDMLSKSGKTIDSVSLVANTEYVIDISDLASTNVAITIYSVTGTVLSQEYGMFVDVDTVTGEVKITSSIDVNVKVVIAADISGMTIA